ncbi:MAG TPA: hypothetical protein VH476_06635 [Solirubrobacterales bacterium]
MADRLSTELQNATPAERRDPAFERRAREILMRIDPTRLHLTLAVFLASIARSLEKSPDALYGPGWNARIQLLENAAVTSRAAAEQEYAREWERLMRGVRAPLTSAPTSASRA